MSGAANVKGLDQLQALLNTLSAKVETNIMRAALRAGANVIRDEVRQTAPFDTGLLRKGIKVSTRARRGVVTATIKASGKHSHAAAWLEYGTLPHIIKARQAKGLAIDGAFAEVVNNPGVKARPYMRPALDSRAQAAVLAVGEAIKVRLTKQGLDGAGVELETE